MITVTTAAVTKIETDAAASQNHGMALRLAVRKESDGTFHYGMGFDEASEEDVNYQFGNLSVVFAPEFAELLNGATLDYVELEPGSFNFIFLNPNDPNYAPPAAAGGGCGSGGCSGCH
ncbi:MAG: iron-sulfur cluster assembly accessory protein [Gammaproteobacteria bacterium]|nr:iron-sulfur cluster assembly accessory protein [Gammaproteobacteria bacterium]